MYIEQMYYSFYLTRQLLDCRMDPNPCVYILFRITHYQITTFVFFNSNQFVGCFIKFCDPKNIYLDTNIA